MQLWDTLCSWLRARCISVEDVSNKVRMIMIICHLVRQATSDRWHTGWTISAYAQDLAAILYLEVSTCLFGFRDAE